MDKRNIESRHPDSGSVWQKKNTENNHLKIVSESLLKMAQWFSFFLLLFEIHRSACRDRMKEQQIRRLGPFDGETAKFWGFLSVPVGHETTTREH